MFAAAASAAAPAAAARAASGRRRPRGAAASDGAPAPGGNKRRRDNGPTVAQLDAKRKELGLPKASGYEPKEALAARVRAAEAQKGEEQPEARVVGAWVVGSGLEAAEWEGGGVRKRECMY